MYAELKRKCSDCKLRKNISDFYKDKSESTGYSYKCKICKLAFNQAQSKKPSFRKKSKEYEIKRGLKRHYGITVDRYNEMFTAQLGRCAVCFKHQTDCKRRLAVDHDHESGKIRGLLCDNCNPGIGYFKHSIEIMKQAIVYLEKFQK